MGRLLPPAVQLLHYVKDNASVQVIRFFIQENPEIINMVYNNKDSLINIPILYIACSTLADTVNPEIVETLIECGADLYYKDELRDDKEALHFAVLGGNPRILKIIVKNLKPGKINALSDGNTALNLLIKEGDFRNPGFIECVRILVQAGIDVNIPDKYGLPPIFYAEKRHYKDVVELILDTSKKRIDIERHKLGNDPSAFLLYDAPDKISHKSIIASLKGSIKYREKPTVYSKFRFLLNFLKEHNEEDFIEFKDLADFVDLDDGEFTLLQCATKHGLTRAVISLLDKGADPNKITAATRTTPLEIAITKGYKEIALNLLKSGASLACENKFGLLPIENIDANYTVDRHLNECLEVDETTNNNKKDFFALYRYRTLITPGRIINENDEIQQLASEIQVISNINKCPKLQNLLKHPVITSFLYLKWHRVRGLFYASLAFYIAFLLSLSLYLLVVYDNQNNNETQTIDDILSVLLCTTLILLVSREFFQIIVIPDIYSYSKNLVKITLIIFTIIILFQISFLDTFIKQVSSLAMLSVAYELITLLGQLSKVSTKITLLRKLLSHCFGILLWYLILILALSLSFYTVLHMEYNSENPDGAENLEFYSLINLIKSNMSLVNIVPMLNSVLDVSVISYLTFVIINRGILLMFAVIIALLLYSLLRTISNKAKQLSKGNFELVGHIERIEYIAYLEECFLSDRLYYSRLPTEITKGILYVMLNTLGRYVFIFPYFLKGYSVVVYPNQQARIALINSSGRYSKTNIYLDKQTANRTKQLILRQKNQVALGRY